MTEVPNLRPRNDWIKVLGFLGGLIAAGWGIASWAARAPTPERVEKLSIDLTEVRLNVAVMKVQMEGIQRAVDDIKKHQEDTADQRGQRNRNRQ